MIQSASRDATPVGLRTRKSVSRRNVPPYAIHRVRRRNKPVHQILTEYIALLQEAKRKPRTINNVRQAVEVYQTWVDAQGLDITNVTQAQFREYVRELQTRYADGTVKRHFITIRSTYKYAVEMGWAPLNPTAGLSKLLPREQDREPELYAADEMRALVAALETDREEMLLYGLALTGMRQFEFLALKWEKENDDDSFIDFENNQFVVIGKQGKLRYVPIHPILNGKLLAYRSSPRGGASRYVLESSWFWGAMVPSTATTCLVNLIERAGIPKPEKPSHSFRKTLNTNLSRQSVRGAVLDEIFGWAKTTVRERYYTGRSTSEAHAAIMMAYQDDPVFPEQRHLATTSDPMMSEEITRLKLEKEILELKLKLAATQAA